MERITSGMKVLSIALLSLLIAISFTSVSHAEWSHGIGTGFFGLNIEGDIGVNTVLAGPVKVEDIDLDFDDISNVMETALGVAGYSTDGTWMIKYSYQMMELEGKKSHTLPGNAILPGGHTVSASLNFEATGAEITVGYPVYQDPSVIISVDGGLRYTKHEINASLGISGPVLNSTLSKNVDEDWTDFLIGGTVTVPLTKEWIWNTTANAGFGGSEGTYMGQTGVTWIFYKNWSTTLYGKYAAVEYENASKGETNWYLYDVDEFGVGLSFAYNW
jgi:hypothetical protein